MSDHELEQLATRLAAMANEQREWILARMKDLLRQRRLVGRRLSGKRDDLFARIVTNGFLYDIDGNAVVRIQHVDLRKDVDKAQTNIYITGHGVGE